MRNHSNIQKAIDRVITVMQSHRELFSVDEIEALERDNEIFVQEINNQKSDAQIKKSKELAVDLVSLIVKIVTKSFFEE